MTEVNESIIWSSSVEKLIKDIGEKSLSYSWLHRRSEKRFSYYNNFLAIPAIVLSTITGAGSIGFGKDGSISLVMGGISILVSIIATLNSYFSFAKRAEAHRITSVSYNKLYLMISIELSLPRVKRVSVKDFLKMVSDSITRLKEIEPQIPDKVISEYKIKFKDEPGTISKPEETNGLAEILVYQGLPETPPPEPNHPPSEETKFTIDIPKVAKAEKPWK